MMLAKKEILTKRPPGGHRVMIFPEICIMFYGESDGNDPGAQNPPQNVENERNNF